MLLQEQIKTTVVLMGNLSKAFKTAYIETLNKGALTLTVKMTNLALSNLVTSKG